MARKLSSEAENTRNSLEYVGAGAGLIGASALADAAVAADRKRKGMDGPIRAAAKRKFTRRHAGQLGVKVAGRAAFAAGAPLAAYGAYSAMKPKEKTPRLNVKRDVVQPVAQGVALKDLADQQANRVKKSDLTRKETQTLVQRKKRGQKISIAAGGMGLAALGLRAPEAAKFAAKKAPKLKPLQRLAAKEPGATKASNALGVASIGTGAAGSLNYAAQQKLEAKQVEAKKSLYDGVVRGIGRVRVVERTKPGFVTVYDSRDVKRFMPEARVTPVKKPKAKGKVVPVDKPAAVQLELFKADKFLREYGDRISPKAEEGYKYLKRGRNERAASAGLSAGFAGLSGGLGVHALKRGSKGWAAVGAAGAVLNGAAAVREGRQAARWTGKLRKIEAKGRERAAAGQFGPGREVAKSAGKKAEGAAQAAAGGAALGLGLSTNRLVNVAERAGANRVERWRSSKVAAMGNPVVRTQSGAPRAAKVRASAKTKANQGAINEVNRKANKATRVLRRSLGGATRGALITAGFATAVPNVWLGSRKMVEKADKHDVDAFMGGALGTAGAYHGALYATKGVDRRIERNLATDPKMKATLNEHRRVVGLPKDAKKGDSRWLKYHREYPKSIPGWKWKRTMSRLQGGKSQIAATGAVAAAGGLGAAAANRKIHPKKDRVGKAFGLPSLPKGRLVPKSPLMRKPSVRQGYVGTSVSGKKFSVRGSVR